MPRCARTRVHHGQPRTASRRIAAETPQGWRGTENRREGSGFDLELNTRPFSICGCGRAAAILAKFLLGLGRVEEIEPLRVDQPKPRVTRHHHAAANPHRIVAAEARHVDAGIGHVSGPVPGASKSPCRTGKWLFELAFSLQRLAVGKIGDRIEAADRQTAGGIDHDRLRGPASAFEAEAAPYGCGKQNGGSGTPGNRCPSRYPSRRVAPAWLSPPPRRGHSIAH